MKFQITYLEYMQTMTTFANLTAKWGVTQYKSHADRSNEVSFMHVFLSFGATIASNPISLERACNNLGRRLFGVLISEMRFWSHR